MQGIFVENKRFHSHATSITFKVHEADSSSDFLKKPHISPFDFFARVSFVRFHAQLDTIAARKLSIFVGTCLCAADVLNDQEDSDFKRSLRK